MAASLAVLLLSIPMLLLREPPRDRALAVGHRPGLMHALRRPEIRIGLVLMLLSSVGVRLTLGMFGPFLLDKGLSLEQLGWLFGSLHIGAGLTGAFLGGILVRTAPGWRAVWIAVGLKALVLAALTLAAPTASLTVLMVLVGLMFAVLGFVWVALYSALMGLTSPLQSGVDFTLFRVLMPCWRWQAVWPEAGCPNILDTKCASTGGGFSRGRGTGSQAQGSFPG